MRIIGFILIMTNSILVGGAVANRRKSLDKNQMVFITAIAIIQVLTGFMAGILLMR